MHRILNYFPKYFTNKAILFYILTLILSLAVFFKNYMSLIWVGFGLTEVIIFFYFSNILSRKWANLHPDAYVKRLFWYSFLIRCIYVIFSYYFFILMTGKPFEFEAADSLFYDQAGQNLCDQLIDGKLNVFSDLPTLALSDKGFPIYLGILYVFLFKSVILTRIVTALFGAWSSVLAYRIARRNFGEETGRIAGILVMLVPTLIYYCGMHLKEIFMTYLCLVFINTADRALRSHGFGFKQIALLVLSGGALFMFRTVLAICALASLGIAILMTSGRITDIYKRIFTGVGLALGFFLVLMTTAKEEMEFLIQNRSSNQKSQMEYYSTTEGANPWSKYGSTAIFTALILPAPFPAYVATDQANSNMINGNVYTRNVYAYFVILAVVLLFQRKQFRKHTLLLSFLGMYLAVLAFSGFALSERFHMVAVPFLLIFASYGINQSTVRNRVWFIPYMIFICLLIVGWNWFKLAGRGMF